MVAITPVSVNLGSIHSADGKGDQEKPNTLPGLAQVAQQEGDDYAIAELGMPPECADSFPALPFTNRDGAPVDANQMRGGHEEVFVKRLSSLVGDVYKQNLKALAQEHQPASAAEWEQVREEAWRLTMSQKDVAQVVDRMLDDGAEISSATA